METLGVLFEKRIPLAFDENEIGQLPAGWIEPFGIKSLLAVPLVSKNRVTGLMVLDHTRTGQRFTDEQKNLAMTIGAQVIIAIDNARLFEETVEARKRTEMIVAQAFSGIMVLDRDTRIVNVNPEAEALAGFSANELVGRRFSEMFAPELWDERSPLARAMRTGARVPPTETVLAGMSGSRDILLGVTPFHDGYLLNFADISRLKAVERLKTNIVANVSHELRAPLASIKAYAELLLADLDGEDRALRHRFVSVIDQEADWLTELINALLDLSRLESGQYEPRMDLLSVADVVGEVVAALDMPRRQKEIEVCLDLAPDLPLILADRELIAILLKNLISNAIKFSLEGGRVSIRAWRAGGHLLLDVEDEGIGISEDDLAHLFTKFFRAGLAKERGIRGTGLGLVLAREAAEMHGGWIEVESELGVGTRFRVTMPLDAMDRQVASPLMDADARVRAAATLG
jgi:PAS domain S-box-containing protein